MEDLKNLRKFGKRYANVSLFRVENVNIFVHLWIGKNDISVDVMAENNEVYTTLKDGFGFQGNS